MRIGELPMATDRTADPAAAGRAAPGAFAGVRAVIFDYGNTLVPFGAAEAAAVDAALRGAIERSGPCDAAVLHALRRRQAMRPYADGWRENDVDACSRELLLALRGRIDEATVAEMRRARLDAFHGCVRCGPATAAVLPRLAERFRLALLSNYPCGEAIRGSLERLDLARWFAAVVVSADRGWAKPHPAIYDEVLAALGEPAEACVMVGDNWLADVQGAKRRGLRAIHTAEYGISADFPPAAGDLPPDARIADLRELPALLGCPVG